MIRTMIVDDHALVRFGIARMLKDAAGIEVVAQAETGEQAVDLARSERPNVVLMDLCMPGIGGLEAARRIDRLELDIKVIALTARDDDLFPMQAMKVGVAGYLTKGVAAAELVSAVRKVFVGQRFVCSDVAQRLALRNLEPEPDASPFLVLSSREMQITLMVVNCQRVQAISTRLHLSPKTVNSYRYRIFEKLEVTSDVELTLLAVRHGLIDVPVPKGPGAAGRALQAATRSA